ncbi:MAG: tRNA lysidine(34) synthetase TilS [Thiohalomonadaceae bacterium]
MGFEPAQLLSVLRRLPPAQRYLVAFSGGCDSTVLLHALVMLRETLAAPIAALHVDHGLQAQSEAWARRCEAQCASWQVPFIGRRVNARARAGESGEAAARHARYAALRAAMQAGDVLLTAHHRDDQAETFLLQLLRGAGPRGLAAMPECAPFGAGHLARPLLGFARDELCAYARQAGLQWIDDPSNFDTVFDRNFLRNEVMPALRGRWPAAGRVIARAAAHQAEAAELLDVLAEGDAAQARTGEALSVSALRALSGARARNLLRWWIHRRGLPVPDAGRLHRILDEVVGARADAEPRVNWPGAEARRYRDGLFVLPPQAPVPAAALPWDGCTELVVPGMGRLSAVDAPGALAPGVRAMGLTVRFGAAGVRCRPAGRTHHHALKKLWQEAGVPPWVRERTPLVFADGRLAAVVGRWTCEEFTVSAGETGWLPVWRPFDVETQGENGDNLPGPAP